MFPVSEYRAPQSPSPDHVGVPRRFVTSIVLAVTLLGLGATFAQSPTLTILMPDAPWLAGFESLVERYEADTGNDVELNITPNSGIPQKARNAVSASVSEFDIIPLNETRYSVYYSNELVVPLNDIDPDFTLDPEVIQYDNATRWNAELNASTADGALYGVPINGNLQLFFYRADLFEEHGLGVPQTWDDVEEAAKVLHDPPRMFGLANRTSPGSWEPLSYIYGEGGGILEQDPTTGQWHVTATEEASVEGLRLWVRLSKTYGPPDYANLGQAQVLSLMQSGRAAMVHVAASAAPNFEDPEQSVVPGNVGTTVIPGPTPDMRATMSGIWLLAIPANLPPERQKAALEFLDYALSKDAQTLYAREGAIPVRQDVYEELGQEEAFRWMQAMADSAPFIHALPRMDGTAQINAILERNFSEAVLEQVTPEQAMQTVAEEVHALLTESGFDVAPLDQE